MSVFRSRVERTTLIHKIIFLEALRLFTIFTVYLIFEQFKIRYTRLLDRENFEQKN